MDNDLRTQAEVAARLLLQDYYTTYPGQEDQPVPLEALADWLGFHVVTFHPTDHPEGTYGFIDADEDEHLIWLCRDLPEGLHRFTLAHELGHALLHCHNGQHLQELADRHPELQSFATLLASDSHLPLSFSRAAPCHSSDIQEDQSSQSDDPLLDILGPGVNYDPRSQRELAANIFAAELLLPVERIRKLYLHERLSAPLLAARFGVSHAALLNRLAGLLQPLSTIEPAQVQEQATTSVPSTPAHKRYDEFQLAAIEAPTPALIVAGPGSGKTSTLIGRAAYLIQDLAIPPQQILALTFSRKATQEMEERLRHLLEPTSKLLPRVSTFHAFCADLLRQYGSAIGLRSDFALIDEAEGYFLLRQIAHKVRLRHYQTLHAPAHYFPALLKAISRARDELISPAAYTALAEAMQAQARNEGEQEQASKALEIAQVYTIYDRELHRRGDTDFGGLLTLTLQLFQEQPAILQTQQLKYQHILVDEFQDVNRASGVLLHVLAGKARNVWVVGDSNQAIYGFRGASPANIGKFTTDFPGATILPLSRNYRSRPDLVAIAESFRCGQLETDQKPGKNQPARPSPPDAAITLATALDDTYEIAGIVQDIQTRRQAGTSYNDMIVLCRTRSLAQKISRALATADIPVIEQSGMLEQEAMKDALSPLLLLTDRSGMGLLRAGSNREHPISRQDIEALLMAAREPNTSPRQFLLTGEVPLTVSPAGRHSLLRLADILQTLSRLPDTWSVLAHYLLIETTALRDLLITPESKESQQTLANYERLLQLARHYDQQLRIRLQLQEKEAQEEGTEAPSQPTLEERLKGFLEYLTLLVMLRQDNGGSSSAEGGQEAKREIVRVMTVHASKGLEFPIVYLPGLVQRRFPFQAQPDLAPPPAGMLPPEGEGSTAHEIGESCLFYVGVTRAREQLILSYSERYGKLAYKRSLYLDALETDLPDERITRLRWDHTSLQLHTIPASDSNSQKVIAPQPGREFITTMRSPVLSSSAIEAYQRCPRQYAYSNIYHFASETSTYQIFWAATQKTLEDLRHQHQAGKQVETLSQEAIQELYNHHWQELGGQAAPFAALYEQHGYEVITAIQHRLFSTVETFDWDLRSPFEVEIDGTPIHVTVDRIEASYQTEEPLRFVRTRYGRRKEKPAAETRELFYILASRQHHPERTVELHSHNMSTGETMPIKMTGKKEQSLYENVTRAIKGLREHNYPAQPEQPRNCPTCPFFLICPS